MGAIKRGRPVAKAFVAVAVFLIAVMLLLTPAVQSFLVDLITSPFRARYPASAAFSLERSLTVEANGGQVIGYGLDISEPSQISQNGYLMQEVTSITYSPQLSFEGTRYGNGWVGWNGSAISGDETRTFKATYQVTVHTHIWSIDRGDSLTVDDVPASLQDMYLHDEWEVTDGQGVPQGHRIDTTSPAIVSTSSGIVGNETNVYQVLKGIYGWMVANVEYSTDPSGEEPQAALETLRTLRGDCDDQSILFCSLARAAGVPAWLQMGALYVTADDSWGGHGWLQAYIPLVSGGGENVTIDVVNKDFLVLQPDRFIDFTDDGVGAHLADYYRTFQATIVQETYADGRMPFFIESYTKLSYVESSKKVSEDGVYLLERELTQLCSAPARPRT